MPYKTRPFVYKELPLNRIFITSLQDFESTTMKVFAALLCVVALVAAEADYSETPEYKPEYKPQYKPSYPAPAYNKPAYKQEKYEEVYAPPRPYGFGYNVADKETYTTYDRYENSDGQTVSGSYKVHLPDGRIQTVTYKAGPGGNVAEVTYEGTPVYPDYVRADGPNVYPADYTGYRPKAYEAPRYEQPKYEAPRYEQPKYEAPRYEQPKYDVPVYEPKY